MSFDIDTKGHTNITVKNSRLPSEIWSTALKFHFIHSRNNVTMNFAWYAYKMLYSGNVKWFEYIITNHGEEFDFDLLNANPDLILILFDDKINNVVRLNFWRTFSINDAYHLCNKIAYDNRTALHEAIVKKNSLMLEFILGLGVTRINNFGGTIFNYRGHVIHKHNPDDYKTNLVNSIIHTYCIEKEWERSPRGSWVIACIALFDG